MICEKRTESFCSFVYEDNLSIPEVTKAKLKFTSGTEESKAGEQARSNFPFSPARFRSVPDTRGPREHAAFEKVIGVQVEHSC